MSMKRLVVELTLLLAAVTVFFASAVYYKTGKAVDFGHVGKPQKSMSGDGLVRVTFTRRDWPAHPDLQSTFTRFYNAEGEVVKDVYTLGDTRADGFLAEAVTESAGEIVLYTANKKSVPLTSDAKREARFLLDMERHKFGLPTS